MINPLAAASDGLLGNGSVSIATRGLIEIKSAVKKVISSGTDLYRRIREDDDRVLQQIVRMFMEIK